MSTKQFNISDILSVSTGRMVADRGMEGLYDILGHMTNDHGITTIGLMMVADSCKSYMLETFPNLNAVEDESLNRGMEAASSRENSEVASILSQAVCRLWVDRMAELVGQTDFDVPSMENVEPRDFMDDIRDVQNINPNAKIVVLKTDTEQ